MKNERDNKGKFVKGNKAGRGRRLPKDARIMKEASKIEIIKCAYSLTFSAHSLKEQIRQYKVDSSKSNMSRLEYITANAVQKNNTKFIQWLLEKVTGRPIQEVSFDSENNPTLLMPISVEQQRSLIDEALKAREQKIMEEKKKKRGRDD